MKLCRLARENATTMENKKYYKTPDMYREDLQEALTVLRAYKTHDHFPFISNEEYIALLEEEAVRVGA